MPACVVFWCVAAAAPGAAECPVHRRYPVHGDETRDAWEARVAAKLEAEARRGTREPRDRSRGRA